MSAVVDQIDLSSYSVEELNELVEKAKMEVAIKEQNRVQEIRSQMEKLASDLNMSVDEVMRFDVKKKKTGSKPASKVKFRNPNNPEQTWTGRGKRPRWLQEALDKGAHLEDFAIAK